MSRITHVTISDNFAGIERYVCTIASELQRRGWEVDVVGGERTAMSAHLEAGVSWHPARTTKEALAACLAQPSRDLLHVHDTAAEMVGLALTLGRRTRFVTTRHFLQQQTANPLIRVRRRLFAHLTTARLAVSETVAKSYERPLEHVILLGVDTCESDYNLKSTTVLIAQRLEPDKATALGLEAWRRSGLGAAGWQLRVLGDGSERSRLQAWVRDHGLEDSVAFDGWSDKVRETLTKSAILLATAPNEPFGLSVVEAMACGVPVIATASGGHLETVGAVAGACLFETANPDEAAMQLHSLANDLERRLALSQALRRHQRENLTTSAHVDRLEALYRRLLDQGT